MSSSDSILWPLLALVAHQEALISQLAAEVDNARRDAGTDRLTGLANLRGLRDFVCSYEHDLTAGIGHILLIDGDGIKRINDRYGHDTGDRAIRHIASAIGGAVGDGGLAARRGGDEFLALIAPTREVKDVVGRILAALDKPLPVGGPPVGVSLDRLETTTVMVSIGVRRVEPGVSFSALMNDADAAMYQAKAAGRQLGVSCCHHWTPSG